MRRAVSIAIGLVLIAVAFLSAGQVADTHDGLIAEIVTLISGLAGVGLLLYGLVPKRQPMIASRPAVIQPPRGPRSANDLLLGGGGFLLAAILLGGLAASGGWGWAALGAVLLVPMLGGCAYLVIAFTRAPIREWTIDLHRLFRMRAED